MRTRATYTTLLLGLVLVALCGCEMGAPHEGQAGLNYSDPIAYCEAVGTISSPDERYVGVAMPEVIIEGMVAQGVLSADAPPEFAQNAVWRCMENKVWFCHFGANLPCQEQADLSTLPTEAMQEFCTANPEAEVIPAAVTGRATVFEWACADGEPEVVRQVFDRDPQGYIGDFWYELGSE